VSCRLPTLAAALAGLALAGCSGSITGSGSTGNRTGTGTAGTATTPGPGPTRTGTSSGRTVDAARLERTIAASAETQSHQRSAVICPPEIAVATGLRFYCAAQSDGEVTPFLVTEGAGGKLTYRKVPPATAPSVDMPQIEIEIAQSVSARHETARSVSCPQEMPRQQGLTFVCAATITAGKATTRASFIVHELNSLGRVSFALR
jgi:hypothetical protein